MSLISRKGVGRRSCKTCAGSALCALLILHAVICLRGAGVLGCWTVAGRLSAVVQVGRQASGHSTVQRHSGCLGVTFRLTLRAPYVIGTLMSTDHRTPDMPRRPGLWREPPALVRPSRPAGTTALARIGGTRLLPTPACCLSSQPSAHPTTSRSTMLG